MRYAACGSHINEFHDLAQVMIQANTWQRLVVGRALRHETFDLDHDILELIVSTCTFNDLHGNSC